MGTGESHEVQQILHLDHGNSHYQNRLRDERIVHRSVGVSPEESHKNGPWDGTPSLHGQTEIAGAVQPGKEKAVR